MKFIRLKKFLAAILLILTTSSLFAVEEYVSKIYKDIDIIFVEKSDEKLNDILQTNKDDKYYYLIENYAEKKIRRLIVVNDYEFAMSAIVVVIENNLDNEEAVEMYSTIADAYAIQIEYEEKQELLRQQELARIEGEKEKQRTSADKEYVSSKTADGSSSVYVTGKETKSTNSDCDFSFGLVNFSILNEIESKFMGTNYGISANLNYIYNLQKTMFGVDAYGALNFLAIGDQTESLPLLMDVNLSAKYGLASLSKNLFVRAGICVLNTGKNTAALTTQSVADALISPNLGIQLANIHLGDMNFNMNVDYLLGTLWTQGYKAGVQGMLDFAIPYAKLERLNLYFHVGLRDTLFIKDNGTENRACVILAVGAKNVSN